MLHVTRYLLRLPLWPGPVLCVQTSKQPLQASTQGRGSSWYIVGSCAMPAAKSGRACMAEQQRPQSL
jgi:hypothetical protein